MLILIRVDLKGDAGEFLLAVILINFLNDQTGQSIGEFAIFFYVPVFIKCDKNSFIA